MDRSNYLFEMQQLLQQFPAVCLLGPRQVGKTTLAKMYAAQEGSRYSAVHHFDLEDPADFESLQNPKLTLSRLEGLIIVDEIQRQPALFPLLRVLIDSPPKTQKWLLLGSASRELLHQSSDTLAGRLAYLEVTPFSYLEAQNMTQLWERGGFPGAYLAETEAHSLEWRKQYVRTYLEQDIPNLGLRIPATQLRRFWMMLAHYHGNVVNLAEFSRALGLNVNTIRQYLDILTDTFMVRQLQPWWENISKRQVKSAKIYFRDSGLLHSLLDIPSGEGLHLHPKVGASWEGFALEEVLKLHAFDSDQAYFWCTQSHAELDLFLLRQGKRIGIEFKYSDAPKLTKSMRIACEDLRLDELYVLYPGEKTYWLEDRICVCPLTQYLSTY